MVSSGWPYVGGIEAQRRRGQKYDNKGRNCFLLAFSYRPVDWPI
jgi:hypothetical protein